MPYVLTEAQIFILTVLYKDGEIKTHGMGYSVTDHRKVSHPIKEVSLLKLKGMGLLNANSNKTQFSTRFYFNYRISKEGRIEGSRLEQAKKLAILPDVSVGYFMERDKDQVFIAEVNFINEPNNYRVLNCSFGYKISTKRYPKSGHIPWATTKEECLVDYIEIVKDRILHSKLNLDRHEKDFGVATVMLDELS